jgi:hypothetical protein
MKKLLAVVLAVIIFASLSGVALAAKDTTGNGAPSGAHYNLNIIGVKNPKTADMTDTNGHTIFVNIDKPSKINLCQSGVEGGCAPDDDFVVLDRNGTDGNGALFALPNPDPGEERCTAYSVYVRALGNPGGKADMTTCAMVLIDPDGIPDSGDEYLEEVCSTEVVKLDASVRPQKFTNVSKELLTICADLDGDGDYARYYLFDDALEGYFWDYDNHGLRLAQLRFYMQPTCYSAEDWECKGGD